MFINLVLLFTLANVNLDEKVSRSDFYSLVATPPAPKQGKHIVKEDLRLKPREIVVRPLHPSKGWYSNITLNINGKTYYGLTMFGYLDPSNPTRFIYEKAEQPDGVKALIDPPIFVPMGNQPRYYITEDGTPYCVGGT